MATNIKSTRPLFDRVVVREVIDNAQTFLDLKENNPDAYAKIFQKNQNIQAAEVVQSENTPFSAGNSGVDPKIGLLSDLSSESEKALLMAPPNSIVGVVVTPGFEYDSTPKIFYPMFPPHLSFPVKPGETVWVVNPGRKDEFSTPFGSKKTAQESAVSGELTNAGFWICRIPSPAYVDDLNFTHDDRSRSYYYRDSQEPNVNLSDFPPDFSNGPYSDGRSPTLYDSSYDFSNIRAKSLSNNLTSRESVPRFTKRPGDLVIQGSNNTLISLGEDRPRSEQGSNTQYRGKEKSGPRVNPKEGTIDIVAGRGFSPEGSVNNQTSVKNTLDQDETEKRTWARDTAKKRIVKVTEGDPDLIHDLSRIYVSMKTDGDKNFGFDNASLLPDPGNALDPVDGKPYVVLKSNEIRILARQTKDGQEVKENGSIRIIKEGTRENGHSVDQAVITFQPDGTIMIDGPKIVIGSGNEKDNGQGDQVLIGGSSADQPIVLGNELKSLIEDLITAIKAITVPTGTGPSGPPINSAQFESVSLKLKNMLSKVGKTK
jgi:hypothetical protein